MRGRASSRGAALVEYGLLIGLIAVLAIASVFRLGVGVSDIFTLVGSEVAGIGLASAQEEAGGDLSFDAAASGFHVNGGGGDVAVAGDVRDVVVTNTMDTATEDLIVVLESMSNFEIVADGCSGTVLAPSSSCTVTVRSTASGNGAFEDALRVYY